MRQETQDTTWFPRPWARGWDLAAHLRWDRASAEAAKEPSAGSGAGACGHSSSRGAGCLWGARSKVPSTPWAGSGAWWERGSTAPALPLGRGRRWRRGAHRCGEQLRAQAPAGAEGGQRGPQPWGHRCCAHSPASLCFAICDTGVSPVSARVPSRRATPFSCRWGSVAGAAPFPFAPSPRWHLRLDRGRVKTEPVPRPRDEKRSAQGSRRWHRG